jgi:hypothetical protein
MSGINTDRNRFGLTRRQFNFFLIISILWLTCCFSLFIPPIRNLIISFGETFIVHRPLTHPVWHERFISYSIGGIVLYVICLWFFLLISFPSIIAGKKKYILLAAISLIFVFIIMYKAGWTFSDDHEFISTTAVNKYTPNFVSGGRFAPFKYIKYNLLLFVFRCLGINTGLPVEAHFIVVSMFFIATFFCLFFLINKIEPVKIKGAYPAINWFFLSTFFLLGSSFCSVFLSTIFPETEVIMLFALFMLMYYKALETDKTRYYTVAFLSAVYGTYCKEPVFGAFAVIALVNYVFRYKKSKREKLFYIALIANGVLFIILYYFLSYKNTSGFYNEGRVYINGFKFLLSVFKGNPVLIIMFCFGLIRLYFVIVRKEKKSLFYDSLLFAGIAYAFAFFILHLNGDYYYLPSIIFFFPSLVYWIKYLFERKRAFAVTLLIILLPIYSYNYVQTAARIKGIWRERQEFMPYITSLLSDHNNGKEFIWYESDNRMTDDTFYIAARNWRKHIENAFLNYLNKSEGMDFFVSEKSLDHITFNQNILFFYPVDNDQNQPMRDELVKILQDNNFALYKDSYGVLIYKQY